MPYKRFLASDSNITEWSRQHSFPSADAHRPFTQYAVLDSVAADPSLSATLILRGASALHLFRGGIRRSRDLDFLILNLTSPRPYDPKPVREKLNALLNRSLPSYFPGQPQWAKWVAEIKIDLAASLNVCECAGVCLSRTEDQENILKVATLEDIMAEKLTGILAALPGGKRREQDLFDVASLLANASDAFDKTKVHHLANRKTTQRGCRFEIASFTPSVRARLSIDYRTLEATTGAAFIPFDEAWDRVLRFVRNLTA